jgi:predicted regulator of Ras-like GTPase activity (Roadblock/LC7/MglB family)
MTREERILKVLTELLTVEDIHACMVARKGFEGIVPPVTDKFKEEVTAIWDVLKKTMDDFFDIINHYSKYGLDKINFQLGTQEVIFFILPQSDTALVAIVPALANRGFIMLELENARRRIISIVESAD